jgi:putative transposase
MMHLVEQHILSKNDPSYEVIDQAAFASKNLWNAANYVVRQAFIHEGIYLDYAKVFHHIKSHDAYQALPRKASNQVLIQLHKAWVAFFEAMAQWREHPEKFVGRPQLPKYKHKTDERKVEQACVDPALFAALDLGVRTLAAITSNKPGFVPVLVNGRVLKSINQGYNKHREQLQSQLLRSRCDASLRSQRPG